MSGKIKEKLNIRLKFNDAISEEQSDVILFRVFDILLNPQKEDDYEISDKCEKNNENN